MIATLTAPSNQQSTLGSTVPPFTPHAISVSLPTWKDNVDYEEGAKRVTDAMVNGYPRFFIHMSIQKVRRYS
jgi:cystathionine gamma-synthase